MCGVVQSGAEKVLKLHGLDHSISLSCDLRRKCKFRFVVVWLTVLWVVGVPSNGVLFSRKEFVDVLLSLSCHFADSSKRNSAFSEKRCLEPKLDLRRSSSSCWNRCLSCRHRHISYCWAYRAATLMSYSDWTMWAFFRWCRAVLRYAYAWVVRSHISIITLLTHCRACAWLRSWVWERFTHNSIATCHSIERYPRRVSTLPITKSWTFTALQMSLFWISELWGANYIWKSLGCLWSKNFRKSQKFVATALPALALWSWEIASDTFCLCLIVHHL